MSRIIKLSVKKLNPEPSANDMKEFGLQYNKEEWYKLSNNKDFLRFFDKNLKVAKNIADKILNIK